ncbi:MAG TPA: hypothetical protein DC042_10910 [Bacteroidales bacterium]|nr:hypothetical protein [Bacteroidales bacterium]
MRLIKNRLLLLLIILQSGWMAHGQEKNKVDMPVKFSIPALALIDFSGPDTRITFISDHEAEQVITPNTLDKTWINYSSIVAGESTNSISVHLSSGILPAQIRINLLVGEDAGAGAGTTGSPSGPVTLTRYPQNIITGIGSCYTGRGSHKGHQLTYSWEGLTSTESGNMVPGSMEISVTYTITSTE